MELVTGATGYIGSRLLRRLRTRAGRCARWRAGPRPSSRCPESSSFAATSSAAKAWPPRSTD